MTDMNCIKKKHLIDITIRFHMTHLMIDLNEVNMISIETI
jgi:hypothetical protein